MFKNEHNITQHACVVHIYIIFCLTPLPLQIKYITLSMLLLIVINVFLVFEVFVKLFLTQF